MAQFNNLQQSDGIKFLCVNGNFMQIVVSHSHCQMMECIAFEKRCGKWRFDGIIKVVGKRSVFHFQAASWGRSKINLMLIREFTIFNLKLLSYFLSQHAKIFNLFSDLRHVTPNSNQLHGTRARLLVCIHMTSMMIGKVKLRIKQILIIPPLHNGTLLCADDNV